MKFTEFNKIYVLVSGGIDSTYLYEHFKKRYGAKVYPLNCFNPYEQSKTLTQISKDPNFIQIKPKEKYKYGDILKASFMNIPHAFNLKKQGKYHKKIFPCCYYIKHKAFMNDPLFQEENTVVISGIKRGDGTQRRIWLTQLSQGREPCNQSCGSPTFFHRHKKGQLYCYPFRDYVYRELPLTILKRLRSKYPHLDHSGCAICPVLVLFPRSCTTENDMKRYKRSLEYASTLGVLEQRLITRFL